MQDHSPLQGWKNLTELRNYLPLPSPLLPSMNSAYILECRKTSLLLHKYKRPCSWRCSFSCTLRQGKLSKQSFNVDEKVLKYTCKYFGIFRAVATMGYFKQIRQKDTPDNSCKRQQKCETRSEVLQLAGDTDKVPRCPSIGSHWSCQRA